MTSDGQWGPPGETPSGQNQPPTTPGESSLPRPPAAPPVAGPPASPPAFTPDGPPPMAASGGDVDHVAVGPVEETRPRGRMAGRLVAAGAAALMLGGGGFLILNAASAQGGAETPEAAFEAAMAAVEAEDVVALAEIMEPSERDTVFEAGFDFVDELVRLEVLDPSLDLSSIEGIDLEFEGFEPRVERPGNGLAHVYLGEGTISGSIDMAALPLGAFLTDRMDADDLAVVEDGEETAGPTSTPLVAVERDGRWYLSLWYTVAENIRLELDAGLPDLASRPARIGGATPEEAVRQMMDDVVALDLRRVIGSMDPEELAVLYDYAPLFLDDADTAANEVLTSLADAGWTWQIVDLGLTSETEGDLATVRMNSMHFRADAENGGTVDIQIGTEEVSVEILLLDDFFDDRFAVSMTVDGECVDFTVDEGYGPTSERLCGDDLGLEQGTDLAELQGQIDALGMVTRQVDGVWYISPMRTGLDAIVTAIEEIDPDSLNAFAEDALELGFEGGLEALDGGLALPDLPGGSSSDDDAFSEDLFEPDTTFESDPLEGLANIDLLTDAFVPDFAYDIDAGGAAQEIEFWAPELASGPFSRGVYASLSGADGGTVALLVVELTDVDAMVELFPEYLAVIGLDAETYEPGIVTEGTDSFDDPVFTVIDGDRLVITGVYGASAEDARRVLEQQTGS